MPAFRNTTLNRTKGRSLGTLKAMLFWISEDKGQKSTLKSFYLFRPCHVSGGWLVGGLSSRKPGFDPGPVNVKFVVDKLTLRYRFFSEHFGFPLLESFHQCSIFIFTLTLLLSQGKRTKPGKLQRKQCHSVYRKAWQTRTLTLLPVFKGP
jgi:hypothetical protein